MHISCAIFDVGDTNKIIQTVNASGSLGSAIVGRLALCDECPIHESRGLPIHAFAISKRKIVHNNVSKSKGKLPTDETCQS